MAITVTATEGGSTANGILLRVKVLTGAVNGTSQTGATGSVSSGTSGQVSITTTQTGSVVYGAALRASTSAPTTNAATTQIDGVPDATHGLWYGTWVSASATGIPGATTFGYTATFTGDIAGLEVLPAGTITEDSSGPAAVSSTAAATVTTASFTPPPGSLLVAMVSSDGGGAQTTMTVSDSSGLSWTEKVPANAAGNGYSGVWIAQVPAAAISHAEPGPVRAARPPAARASGHTATRAGPLGQAGPPVRRWVAPIQAHQLPRRGGRAAGRDGTFTSAAPTSGAPIYPLGHPVRTRPQPPPRGRIARAAGTYAGTGPPAIPLRQPVGLFRRQPPPPARGRTASQRGLYGQAGAPAIPLRRPVRGQPATPLLTGRTASRMGQLFTVPFSAGALTASDTAVATLTAAAASGGSGGVLTASDTRTGGPA